MSNILIASAIHFDMKISGVGSILDTVAKDTEDTANLYLYLYLRYIFGQPVSYQYLKILDEAKDKITFCILSSMPWAQFQDNYFVLLDNLSYSKSIKIFISLKLEFKPKLVHMGVLPEGWLL